MTVENILERCPERASEGRFSLFDGDELACLQSKLSPDRKALLEQTLEIREALGRMGYDVTESVREMRDRID